MKCFFLLKKKSDHFCLGPGAGTARAGSIGWVYFGFEV
jgi:hypothetical protein